MKSDQFTNIGMAAMMPGLQYAIELLTERRDNIRALLQAAQGDAAKGGEAPVKRGRGRPPGSQAKTSWTGMAAADRSAEMRRRRLVSLQRQAAGLGNVRQSKGKSWARMTAEERSIEMKRRMQVAAAKKPLLISNPNHPGNAAWRANLAKARRAEWSKMSAADRKKRLAAMAAGKANGEARA